MPDTAANILSDFPSDQFDILVFYESGGHHDVVDRSSNPQNAIVQDLSKRLRCSACGFRDSRFEHADCVHRSGVNTQDSVTS